MQDWEMRASCDILVALWVRFVKRNVNYIIVATYLLMFL